MDMENAHTVFIQIRSWLIAKALIVSFHCLDGGFYGELILAAI